jgi:carboxyl-terminal processing protease
VIGWRLDEVVQLIRGPGGTVVHLQVLDAGAAPGTPERALYLVRDQVKLEEQAAKSSTIEIPKNGTNYRVGIIDVPSFYLDYAARSRGDEDYTSTTRDVERLIHELNEEGIDGLVIDLRQNGGGHLSEATELSGLFIDQGPVVQLRETRGNIQVLDDPNPDSVYNGPLAVLVDRYSASASEIFAAAIQDYKRGVIIGQQTFGKGSVQNLFDLDRFMRGSGYGQLTLTIGKYYRITGESTQHRGVMPDISLPSIVDANLVGESTRDSALPWDRIQQTSFMADADLDPYIELLQTKHTERAIADPDYNYLVDNIEAAGVFRSQDNVSLNIDVRTAERETMQTQQLARENERRMALGLNLIENMDEVDTSESTDVLLNQATQVVVDMATLSTSTGAPMPRSETVSIR